ncbi:hypothetical protein GCM10007420_26860 [Glycocaulis albus]|uniref:Squalene cyclase C-terminal domain-containing protein n=1 Tax=Glycocaulis albus TaxID=1382801 RepID=A0ABQ1Y193_9PROT|nr:hypothetical protein [Glycocaulis albus]GGH08666.1 hypothetical protein GCM10007420_26860 [Glycocaulis albus]
MIDKLQAGEPAAKAFRRVLDGLLDTYAVNDGVSADAYCATPQWHAMAEGQYLQAVTEAARCAMISKPSALQLLEAGCERLAAGANQRARGDFAQWGLGFAFKNAPADEPYLITSALVTCALADVVNSFPELELATDLLSEAVLGLERFDGAPWSGLDIKAPIPFFSPHIREHVDNTICVWALALHQAASIDGRPSPGVVESVARHILTRRTPETGWAYSASEHVYDLVHQSYIIEGLAGILGPETVENQAIETFSLFKSGEGYIDTVRASNIEHAIDSVIRSSIVDLTFRGGQAMMMRRTGARLWSLGASLACMGSFALNGANPAFWRATIRRFPLDGLRTLAGKDFRQEMHLARGLALCLRALRENGNSIQQTDSMLSGINS